MVQTHEEVHPVRLLISCALLPMEEQHPVDRRAWHRQEKRMFEIAVGKYKVLCHYGGLPKGEYLQRARLAEEFDLSSSEGTAAFFAVGEPCAWPSLAVILRCIPGEQSGFHPGALVVPETDIAFLGGGELLLAYDLTGPLRLWEDSADTGFWSWDRFGDFVLMSAELELAAWDTRARKLWTTFVEPPWSYTVHEGKVCLDVMGKVSSFPLATGPETGE